MSNSRLLGRQSLAETPKYRRQLGLETDLIQHAARAANKLARLSEFGEFGLQCRELGLDIIKIFGLCGL